MGGRGDNKGVTTSNTSTNIDGGKDVSQRIESYVRSEREKDITASQSHEPVGQGSLEKKPKWER